MAKGQLFKIHSSKFEPHPRSDWGQVKALPPNVSGTRAPAFPGAAAGLSARTVSAWFRGTAVSPFSTPAGSGAAELLALRTYKAVALQVASELPGTKAVFPALAAHVRRNVCTEE